MSKPKVYVTTGTRPTETPDGKVLPPDWELYCAPRPLYGTPGYEWQVYFDGPLFSFPRPGTWFAAIDPADPDAATWRDKTWSRDAYRLVFTDEHTAFDRGVAAQRKKYPGANWEKLLAMPSNRTTFIEAGLKELTVLACVGFGYPVPDFDEY